MRKPECGRQSSVAEDENARVQCAIAAVTEKPLGEVLAALVEEEPDLRQHITLPPPTLARLLALKDSLLIPNSRWEEVADTFNVPHASLSAIRRYPTHSRRTRCRAAVAGIHEASA